MIDYVILAMVVTAFITVLVCDCKVKSEWQLIKYTGSSIEPKCVYICKRCNNKSDINYCYCPNCGADMKNGLIRIYYAANEIKLDVDE